MPLPGTEMYDIVSRENYHKKELGFGYGVVETEHFAPKALNDLYKKFTRIKILIFVLRSLLSVRELQHNLQLMGRFRGHVSSTLAAAWSGIVRFENMGRGGLLRTRLRDGGASLRASRGQRAFGGN
jgi:hypothetical protein